MISTSEVRITCIIAEDELETAAACAPRRVRARATRSRRRRSLSGRVSPHPSSAPRALRPASARPTTSCGPGSTRGRRRCASRSPTSRPPAVVASVDRWTAPAGSSLLLSLGLPAAWLRAGACLAAGGDRVGWRWSRRPRRPLGAPPGTVELKWPNDLVVVDDGRRSRKLAGVLGETDGLGTDDPRAVIGIGVNVDWAADGLPADLAATMTCVRARRGPPHRPRDAARRLPRSPGVDGPHGPATGFEADAWVARQVTTGRRSISIAPDGASATVRAAGVDPDSGALLVDDRRGSGRASDRCSSARSVTSASPDQPRPGCNGMARPALRKVDAAGGGRRPRLAHLDLDRSLVEAARRDLRRFDALYRKYVAHVYSYAVYELGDQHEAEDVTERTFLSALAALPRFQERAGPDDGEGRPPSASGCSGSPATSSPSDAGGRRRRPEAPLDAALGTPDPTDVERVVVDRESATAAWQAVDRLARRSPTGGRPALRRTSCRPRRSPRSSASRRGRSGSSSIAPSRGRARPRLPRRDGRA